MIKFYRIFFLLFLLIFLTTYTPNQFKVILNKKNIFFSIKNIEISNNTLIKKSEIFKKLNHILGKNILFIKRDDLENPLKSLDFVERIDVKKKYPSTIIIKIYETKPVAILIKKNKKYFIDNKSNLITFSNKKYLKNLPSVFGEKAEKKFINFFNDLKINNFSINEIKNFYYFKIGRWDIQLVNDKTIKYPSDDISEAIKQSVELLNREDFSDYNVIDLRINGKIVVK